MTADVATPSYGFTDSGMLAGARCEVCGVAVCPPRLGHCGRPMRDAGLEPEGRIEAWSRVHIAPSEQGAPYGIAFVRLEDGPRVVARLDPAFDGIGQPTGHRVRIIGVHGAVGQTSLLACPMEVPQ